MTNKSALVSAGVLGVGAIALGIGNMYCRSQWPSQAWASPTEQQSS